MKEPDSPVVVIRKCIAVSRKNFLVVEGLYMCAWLPVKKTSSTSICFAHSQETLLHYQPN